MRVQRLKTCFICHIYLKSMKQKMYSLDINLYVQQRSLSQEKKVHIKMINHLMKKCV